MPTKSDTIYLLTFADLSVNISAGFLGLVFIYPFSQANIIIAARNLLFGLAFYLLAVKIREVIM
ncbi:hypothetical protein HY085_01695 [Candidatus Gottesmanbacteria bacterium]|nr:hypothetical protein [Candidatus Gottesmanbacteria bacterium]